MGLRAVWLLPIERLCLQFVSGGIRVDIDYAVISIGTAHVEYAIELE
jgi:hypothetical protein